jgi:uncharacterized protein (TIGR02453 family)
MTATFAGFPPCAWAFLDALERDNTKAFFDRERDAYLRGIAEPSKHLVDALATELPARVHPDLHGEARVGRSLFRFNRDIRFSEDKTPYKTHIDFLFWAGEGTPRSSPAVIMRITSTTVLTGAGRMGLRGADLEHHRVAITDPLRGPEVRRIVDRLIASGDALSEPDRVRVPRPYPGDHLNADLLLRDGFHLSRTQPHPGVIHTAGFVDWCVEAFAPYAPLIDWLLI